TDRTTSIFRASPWSRVPCADNDCIVRFATIIALVALTLGSTGSIDAPAYYRAVLASMRQLKEPPFLTYRTIVPGGDGSLVVSRDDAGYAELAVVSGTASSQSWNVGYRASDGFASVALPDGTRALSQLAIFDPTWRGTYVWLHRGLNASMASVTREAALPEPSTSTPPLLAVVTAINEGTYDVSDGGAAQCPNGNAARRLWVHAKSDPLRHPLTGALVDDASLRFCAMHFRERLVSPSVTFDLDVDLRFGNAGGYYLTQGGTIDGVVRPYRRPGWFHISTAFEYDSFAFPATLPQTMFTATGTPTARP
ncbi:MAG TPA: hypothetical protein VKB39_01555, partial [Candidatus Baltobacteraceae bacterium]|nr:hypothetical protein [Candidatus Baltobacteraceae bacterium]